MECILCKKYLRKFRVSKDWNNRNMHKKCWKLNNEYERLQEYIKIHLN